MTAAHQSEFVARDCPHTLDVSKECALDLARVNVPDLDRVVQAARYEHGLLALGTGAKGLFSGALTRESGSGRRGTG